MRSLTVPCRESPPHESSPELPRPLPQTCSSVPGASGSGWGSEDSARENALLPREDVGPDVGDIANGEPEEEGAPLRRRTPSPDSLPAHTDGEEDPSAGSEPSLCLGLLQSTASSGCLSETSRQGGGELSDASASSLAGAPASDPLALHLVGTCEKNSSAEDQSNVESGLHDQDKLGNDTDMREEKEDSTGAVTRTHRARSEVDSDDELSD